MSKATGLSVPYASYLRKGTINAVPVQRAAALARILSRAARLFQPGGARRSIRWTSSVREALAKPLVREVALRPGKSARRNAPWCCKCSNMRTRCCGSSPRPRQHHRPRRPFTARGGAGTGGVVVVEPRWQSTPRHARAVAEWIRHEFAVRDLTLPHCTPGSAGPCPRARAPDSHRVPAARRGRARRVRPALPSGGLCPYLYHFVPTDPEPGAAAR